MDISRLREMIDDDLPIFFEQQLDEGANRIAAFTRRDPGDRAAFDAHWRRIRGDGRIILRAVIVADDDRVAGHVLKYERGGDAEISYWLGRAFWNRGIATAALRQFLAGVVTSRPLPARAAADNGASLRVLEKCGFVPVARQRGFSNARGEEIDEFVLKLQS